MNIDFNQFGTWIYVDPDEQSIELIEESLLKALYSVHLDQHRSMFQIVQNQDSSAPQTQQAEINKKCSLKSRSDVLSVIL